MTSIPHKQGALIANGGLGVRSLARLFAFMPWASRRIANWTISISSAVEGTCVRTSSCITLLRRWHNTQLCSNRLVTEAGFAGRRNCLLHERLVVQARW